jgi:hypothetical protein
MIRPESTIPADYSLCEGRGSDVQCESVSDIMKNLSKVVGHLSQPRYALSTHDSVHAQARGDWQAG